MAAQIEIPLSSVNHPDSHIGRAVADVGMGLVVIAVGVAGLTPNCWLRKLVEPWINIHLLFGALLCGWLTVRVVAREKRSPRMRPDDIRDVSRRISRIAYLVLYCVICTKLCVSVAWNGGHAGFGLPDDIIRAGAGRTPFDPNNDYQMCLASGLAAMVLVRVFVWRVWSRSS
jgi:hypothetical protein